VSCPKLLCCQKTQFSALGVKRSLQEQTTLAAQGSQLIEKSPENGDLGEDLWT